MPSDLRHVGAAMLRTASMCTLTSLQMSSGFRRLMLAENEVHLGDDPIAADRESHTEFVAACRQHLAFEDMQIRAIIGEEDLTSPPPVLPGERICVVDPLDGSTQWAMIRAGYAVASMLLVADNSQRMRLESAVIANPSHTFTLIAGEPLRFGPTYGREMEDVDLLSCVPDAGVMASSFAMTGYKTKDRKSVLALVKRLPEWSFITIGGNPVTPYVAAGNLSCAVTLRNQSPWDALGILMCTKTDAVVGSIDGTVAEGRSFESLFNRIALTHNTRPVPPMIVAKDQLRFEQMVNAIAGARKDVGPDFGQGLDEFFDDNAD